MIAYLRRKKEDIYAFRRSNYLHQMQMHPSRHLISRFRRQLLLKAKPYLDRIAEQCFLHAFRRKVFHAPKGYFMLPLGSISCRPTGGISFFHPGLGRDFTLPQEGLPHPSASPPASPRGEAILCRLATLFFTPNGPFLFDMCDLRFKFKRYW